MRKLITLFIINIFFSSCYSPRYVYSPVTQNIPLLSQKKDFVSGACFAITSGGKQSLLKENNTSLGSDLHTSYAFTNHFAIMLNQYNRWEKNGTGNDFFSGDSLSIKYKRSLTEIGGGYFTLSNTGNTCLQLFGGFAFGKFDINERSYKLGNNFSRFHRSGVTKFFIQPAIISGQKKHFTAAFSSRFSAVFYHNIQTDYSNTELDDYFLTGISKSPVIFWEPAMNYIFGFKKLKPIKFQVQTGIAILMNRRFVDYRSFNLGVGVVANFQKKKNPSKN